MDNSVTIILEKEYAEELIEALRKVESYDDVYDILTVEEYNALDELRETLMMKLGGCNEPSN